MDFYCQVQITKTKDDLDFGYVENLVWGMMICVSAVYLLSNVMHDQWGISIKSITITVFIDTAPLYLFFRYTC